MNWALRTQKKKLNTDEKQSSSDIKSYTFKYIFLNYVKKFFFFSTTYLIFNLWNIPLREFFKVIFSFYNLNDLKYIFDTAVNVTYVIFMNAVQVIPEIQMWSRCWF